MDRLNGTILSLITFSIFLYVTFTFFGIPFINNYLELPVSLYKGILLIAHFSQSMYSCLLLDSLHIYPYYLQHLYFL